MSISSTGLYGSATIVNTDIFDDVQALKEQVTTLSTSYLTTTNEHRIDISQNRLDISSNLNKINDLSNNRINRIKDIEDNVTDLSNNRIKDIEARFKRDATPARKQAHARYKKWTADTKQKQMAGFSASLRSGGVDDSLNQSQTE